MRIYVVSSHIPQIQCTEKLYHIYNAVSSYTTNTIQWKVLCIPKTKMQWEVTCILKHKMLWNVAMQMECTDNLCHIYKAVRSHTTNTWYWEVIPQSLIIYTTHRMMWKGIPHIQRCEKLWRIYNVVISYTTHTMMWEVIQHIQSCVILCHT